MIRVCVFVEGDTEERFVKDVLQPHFNPQGVFLHAINFGGIKKYPSAERVMLVALKSDTGAFYTTMFDYYGMPPSWPGREAARLKPFSERAITVESAIQADISRKLGEQFNTARFIPYVQMHEFEALLFSNPKVLAAGLDLSNESAVRHIRDQFQSPEEINDSQQTAPSKQIVGLSAGYVKVADGILIARRIGLDVMRAECPHFNEWLQKLEAVATRG
jgi:hypothetical protein